MGSKGDAVAEQAESAGPGPAAHELDLFVVHAAADADFVRGYLLPALNLPAQRVLLINDLPLGAVIVSEIDVRCLAAASRSPCCLRRTSQTAGPVFGEQLASHLSVEDVRAIPLRRTDCQLPLRLEARVGTWYEH